MVCFLAASTPFRIRVNFDEDEYRTNKVPATKDADATDGEFAVLPGGIIGKSIFLYIRIEELITKHIKKD